MFTYHIGAIKIESDSINQLRELSQEIGELSKDAGTDLPKSLADICIAIDMDYQKFYDLDEDNWDIVH